MEIGRPRDRACDAKCFLRSHAWVIHIHNRASMNAKPPTLQARHLSAALVPIVVLAALKPPGDNFDIAAALSQASGAHLSCTLNGLSGGGVSASAPSSPTVLAVLPAWCVAYLSYTEHARANLFTPRACACAPVVERAGLQASTQAAINHIRRSHTADTRCSLYTSHARRFAVDSRIRSASCLYPCCRRKRHHMSLARGSMRAVQQGGHFDSASVPHLGAPLMGDWCPMGDCPPGDCPPCENAGGADGVWRGVGKSQPDAKSHFRSKSQVSSYGTRVATGAGEGPPYWNPGMIKRDRMDCADCGLDGILGAVAVPAPSQIVRALCSAVNGDPTR